MIYVSRKVDFSAAHRLHKPLWSSRKNNSVYGKCAGKQPHGHNYELEVVLRGEPDKDTGMLINLNDLKSIIEKNILKSFDHQYLNDLKSFKNVVPTGENICKVVWDKLDKALPNGMLFEVNLKETENNKFTIRKDSW